MASITFACGTFHGGAVDSTLALAAHASVVGHSVRVVLAAGDAYERLPRLTGALVRVDRRSRHLGSAAWRLHDRFSAATVVEPGHAVSVERARDVPAAVGRLHERGGLLVINSVRRLDLERLLELGRTSESHTVWYLREATSLVHAAAHGSAVGTLMANSRPLAEQASVLAGRPCHYVPSLISRDGLAEPTQRRALLAVNPIASHGLDLLLSLARALPQRQLVLQESWPLDAAALRHLSQAVDDLPNVELRRKTARSEVFRDAYALLLPHVAQAIGASRPRVAIEAQLLGIPIVASDTTGLSAIAASPELLIPDGATAEAWVGAIDLLDRSYQRFCEEARVVGDREMPSAPEVWSAFSDACGLAVDEVNPG